MKIGTKKRLTIQEARKLPATLTTREVSALLGVSMDVLHEQARQGTAPVTPFRAGIRWVWPTGQVLKVLGIDV